MYVSPRLPKADKDERSFTGLSGNSRKVIVSTEDEVISHFYFGRVPGRCFLFQSLSPVLDLLHPLQLSLAGVGLPALSPFSHVADRKGVARASSSLSLTRVPQHVGKREDIAVRPHAGLPFMAEFTSDEVNH